VTEDDVARLSGSWTTPTDVANLVGEADRVLTF
jgi:hypothetical protein